MTKLLNSRAAGIDISSKEHVVAIPPERDKEYVRTFGSFTGDLHRLARWLKDHNITSVAMESTGVYWYHLFTILLDYDIDVHLVNAYHVKNVPGRKSDVNDAQWLQQLHSYGLLNSCFQPDNLTRALRSYVRHRKTLIRDITTHTQRMQKALEQMNIKLNNVIRDINGKTGRVIIEKIIQGETNAHTLAQYADARVRASREVMVKSLQGTFREEHLFLLSQSYNTIRFLEQQLETCDKQIQQTLDCFQGVIPQESVTKKAPRTKQPNLPVGEYLKQIYGVDVTRIYGIKQVTALCVFSETGPDLKARFPTQKQWLSWLNVVPDNQVSGGKVIKSKVKKKKNIAGQAFRDAANALWNAQNPLGDYLRNKKAKSGGNQAIVATARKLANIYYKMVTELVEFNPEFLQQNTQEYLMEKLKKLEKAQNKVIAQLSNNHSDRCLVI